MAVPVKTSVKTRTYTVVTDSPELPADAYGKALPPEADKATVVKTTTVVTDSPEPPPILDPKANNKVKLKPKTPPKYVFHAIWIFKALLIATALWTVLLARLFRPGFWSTLMYAGVGLPAGLACSFLYYKRLREKHSARQMLNMMPGAKGITALVQRIPSWLNLSDNEKAGWLNSVLLELWPYYDAAVCALVVDMVDPILESFKPPFIKRINIAKLCFGDAPIRIEAVRMHRDRTDCVMLEFDFRWAGDAEIKLAIDMLIGIGDASRLSPKISKMRLVGTVMVQLRPFVNEVPGFGAVLVSLTKPPKISYHVDLGAALGGSASGSLIASFVSGLLPEILDGFLVWPQRIVTPLFDESVTGPLDNLMLHHQGVLKVTVLEARDIPRMDRLGTSDPSVQIFTDPKRKMWTSTKKNTLAPKWNEDFFLMVQEPETQALRWEMFDTDLVSAKSLLKINIVKGIKDAINSKETMCKGTTSLKQACTGLPGKTIERWFPMGSEDWSDDHGPGKDCGELKLRLIYVPLNRVNPMIGEYGALFVKAKKGRDFPQMVPGVKNSCNPYFEAKVGKVKHESLKLRNTVEPDWQGNELAFYGIPNEEELRLKFMHSSLAADEELGRVTIDVREVRESRHRGVRGMCLKEYELQDADSGYVQIECLFVAHF